MPTNPRPTFKRFVVAFPSLKEGFIRGYRHFLRINGCHLKGPYGGVLLSAVSLDVFMKFTPLPCVFVKVKMLKLRASFCACYKTS